MVIASLADASPSGRRAAIAPLTVGSQRPLKEPDEPRRLRLLGRIEVVAPVEDLDAGTWEGRGQTGRLRSPHRVAAPADRDEDVPTERCECRWIDLMPLHGLGQREQEGGLPGILARLLAVGDLRPKRRQRRVGPR
jgi:hypothetical protein